MRTILFAALLLATATPASADEEYNDCIAGSDGTNAAYAQCGGAWIERADAALNAAWQELRAAADESVFEELLAEQRLWNEYKEKSCLFLATGWFGREGQTISYPNCRAEMIEQRTSELGFYIDLVTGPDR